MSDAFREAVEAAERHAAGQGDLDRRLIGQLQADPGQILAASDEERAYLAVLLDFAGLCDDAAWVLGDISGLGSGDVNPVLRNTEGMLAAAHGEYRQARQLLEEALAAATDTPSLRSAILANLAAVSLQAGEVDDAKAWAERDNEAAIGEAPAAAALIASVQAAVASAENDQPRLNAALARLENVSLWSTADPSNQDVAALALVADMAITSSQLASSTGSVSRLERAAVVLEVAALRLAAELGAGHLQALAAAARLAQVEVEIALARVSSADLEQAVARLEDVSQRANSALGAVSPLAVQLAESVISAKLALNRARSQPDQLPAVITRARVSKDVAGRPSRTAGVGPADTGATAHAVTQKAGLGTLTPLGSGGSGEVFRPDEFRLPGDMTPLAYKEFTTGHAERSHMADAVVSFRAVLSPAERAVLDRYTAWPRALVTDHLGDVCGLLMPLAPPEFFRPLAPGSDEVTPRPREMQWLLAPESIRAAQADLPNISQQDRLALLAQLAYIIAWLHRHGWVYGDLNLKSVLFASDPPRLLLLDCDGAAALSNELRRQSSSVGWDPPELSATWQGGQHQWLLQDTRTDVYKLGLAILRCLTPGRGASTTRDAYRLRHVLDEQGIALVASALSPDPAARPTARNLYLYLSELVRVSASEHASPHAVGTPINVTPRADVRIRADEGIENAAFGQIVMPFYLICDVSFSMYNEMSVLNEGIRRLNRAILSEPVVADVAQVCIMTFSNAAKIVVPLGPPSYSETPRLAAENLTNYGAAFRTLAQAIKEDRISLRTQGYRIYRPCAFFLTDGRPTDPDWHQAFTRSLTYDQQTGSGMREYPIFIPFGFRDAQEEVLAQLAYPPDRSKWYRSKSASAEQSIEGILDMVVATVIASGQAIQTDRRPAIVQQSPRPGSVLEQGSSEYDPDYAV